MNRISFPGLILVAYALLQLILVASLTYGHGLGIPKGAISMWKLSPYAYAVFLHKLIEHANVCPANFGNI